MKLSEAIAICWNINSEEISDELKGMAIHEILKAPTINSINKDNLKDIIRYLWGMVFEFKNDDSEKSGGDLNAK